MVLGILCFVAGMIVMDILWAWKTGTLKVVLNRLYRLCYRS